MNQNILGQPAVFIVVLFALNLFFHIHISIIGSLLLTIILLASFNFMQSCH